MLITQIIALTSMALWLMPPFRQYRSKYFSFFLVLSMGDPFTMVLYTTGLLPAGEINFFIISFFLFLSYDNFSSIRNKKIIELSVVSIISLIILLTGEYAVYASILLNFALLIYFLKDGILHTAKYYEINFYHFVLVLYELSTILKFISIVSSFYNYTYFYLTTIVELLLAVFFVFYREDKPKLSLSLHKRMEDY